jgi:hypothetical protein
MSTSPISLETLRGCAARGALVATIGLAILSFGAWMPAAAQDPAPPAGSAADGLPDIDLSGALLYQLMAAEAAAQRGDLGAAYAIYLKLARDTSDPRLARRAAELALQGRALN